jgi:hypothetical protein
VGDKGAWFLTGMATLHICELKVREQDQRLPRRSCCGHQRADVAPRIKEASWLPSNPLSPHTSQTTLCPPAEILFEHRMGETLKARLKRTTTTVVSPGTGFWFAICEPLALDSIQICYRCLFSHVCICKNSCEPSRSLEDVGWHPQVTA